MAANLTITRISNAQNIAKTQMPDGAGILEELVSITGATSVSDDTGTYTCECGYGFAPFAFIGGPFTASFSGRVMTLTDEAGIGNGVAYGKVLIRPTGS